MSISFPIDNSPLLVSCRSRVPGTAGAHRADEALGQSVREGVRFSNTESLALIVDLIYIRCNLILGCICYKNDRPLQCFAASHPKKRDDPKAVPLLSDTSVTPLGHGRRGGLRRSRGLGGCRSCRRPRSLHLLPLHPAIRTGVQRCFLPGGYFETAAGTFHGSVCRSWPEAHGTPLSRKVNS